MHVDRYERTFIIIAVAMVVIFALAIAVSAMAYGIQVPAPYEQVDPNTVAEPGSVPFGLPEAERIQKDDATGEYEVYIVAKAWSFSPREITVSAGSPVTFYVTSTDVQHGFMIERTNVNVMVLPGQVSKVTATFNEPGTYRFVCHEYCGINHHTMTGQLIVE